MVIDYRTENDIGRYYHWHSQKNFFSTFFQIMNDNIEYLQVLVVQRRFCQIQLNSPVMVSLYICKLKINVKLQEKTIAR